jgi:hypothetical protein
MVMIDTTNAPPKTKGEQMVANATVAAGLMEHIKTIPNVNESYIARIL